MSAEAEDDALLVRAGRGERAAFTALVTRRGPSLMAVLVRMLGDRAVAEEMVQETFARAWREAPRFRAAGAGRAGAAAWLRRVAVNLALDHLRRPRAASMEEVPEPPDPALSAEALLMERERWRAMRDAIGALPDRQRAALALSYDAELTNREGARALGISVGAFELLLVRARRTLRRALAERNRGGAE